MKTNSQNKTNTTQMIFSCENFQKKNNQNLIFNNNKQSLYFIIIISIIIVFLLCKNAPNYTSLTPLILGSITALLGFLPFYFFLKNNSVTFFPLFALHSAYYGVLIGISSMLKININNHILVFEENIISKALLYVFIGLIFLNFGYFNMNKVIKKYKFPYFDINNIKYQTSFFVERNVWIFFFVCLISVQFHNIFIQPLNIIMDWFHSYFFASIITNNIRRISKKLIVFIYIPSLIILHISRGQLGGFATIGILIIGICVGVYRKFPYKIVGIIFIVFVLFQPVKGSFRNMTWYGDSSMSISQKSVLFLKLTYEYWINFTSDLSIKETNVEGQIASRLSDIPALCGVIKYTPKKYDYLYGETYKSLFIKVIPRFLWSNKPIENWGNKWGKRYGFINENDFNTSYNLPWSVEAYMNFGVIGILFGMLFVGGILSLIEHYFFTNPKNVINYSCGLLIAQSFIFPQSHFSMQAGGAILALIVLYLFQKITSVYFNITQPSHNLTVAS